MSLHYSYVPVLHEGRQQFEVIQANGRGTGIILDTARSANGAAQTLNNNARKLMKQRARTEARKCLST
jgi:hypothetical protein